MRNAQAHACTMAKWCRTRPSNSAACWHMHVYATSMPHFTQPPPTPTSTYNAPDHYMLAFIRIHFFEWFTPAVLPLRDTAPLNECTSKSLYTTASQCRTQEAQAQLPSPPSTLQPGFAAVPGHMPKGLASLPHCFCHMPKGLAKLPHCFYACRRHSATLHLLNITSRTPSNLYKTYTKPSTCLSSQHHGNSQNHSLFPLGHSTQKMVVALGGICQRPFLHSRSHSGHLRVATINHAKTTPIAYATRTPNAMIYFTH